MKYTVTDMLKVGLAAVVVILGLKLIFVRLLPVPGLKDVVGSI